jgi:hypothetical protein
VNGRGGDSPPHCSLQICAPASDPSGRNSVVRSDRPNITKILHGLVPAYISDFCEPVSDTNYCCRLRSAAISDLVVPRSCTNFGDRAFRVAGPSALNSLPPSIRLIPTASFKEKLKTHLLTLSYQLHDFQD